MSHLPSTASVLASCLAVSLSLLSPLQADAQAQAQAPITQSQADEILKELRQIRQVLERMSQQQAAAAPTPPAPRDNTITLPAVKGYAMGQADAPLTIVEFTDLQCPFCRRFHEQTFEQLKKEYVDTGKLRFVTRDLPLEAIHPQAMPAALAVRCAGEQGKFWELRRALVLRTTLNADLIQASARELDLDMAAFDKCVAEKRFEADIKRDMQDAQAAGISGTPTFVVGKTTAGPFQGTRMVGAQPFAAFDARLKQLLDAAAAPAPPPAR